MDPIEMLSPTIWARLLLVRFLCGSCPKSPSVHLSNWQNQQHWRPHSMICDTCVLSIFIIVSISSFSLNHVIVFSTNISFLCIIFNIHWTWFLPPTVTRPLYFTKRHFSSSFTSRSKPQQKPTDATQQNSCNTQRNSQHNSINKAQLMQLSGMYCNTHNNTFHYFSLFFGAHSGPKTFHKAPTLVCGECCQNSSYYVLSRRPHPLNPHSLNMGRQWCLSHPSLPLIISLNKFLL